MSKKRTTHTGILLPVLLLALLLAACGKPQAPAPEPTVEPTPAVDYSGLLRISELMVKNRSSLPDSSGQYSDWVELENCSAQPVNLAGWALSDRADEARLPLPADLTLQPGGLCLVFCGEGSFSLSLGETLFLLAPDGSSIDSLYCFSDKADRSLSRDEDGQFHLTAWISPGYPNGVPGYDAWSEASLPAGPLCISEAVVANIEETPQIDGEGCDWVEIQNISDQTVDLSGYYLSDDRNRRDLWQFPARQLAPGELLLVCCTADAPASREDMLNTGFGLSASGEQLWLSDSAGQIVDAVYLHDLPLGGSFGRVSGRGGFFYFLSPTPLAENTGGVRRISQQPLALTPDGVYNGVSALDLEFSGNGTLYYTTDGSVPTTESERYTGPIHIDRTTVVRLLCLEDGALPSRVATYSYFLNEQNHLPVLSLVVDDTATFNNMYTHGIKDVDVPANLALYDGDRSFNQACAVSMKGWTSLSLPKKSLGVSFKGRYGGDLNCDVFGNGITDYSSLAIRAGQDYTFSIFRNELFQELALEGSDSLYTQASKFCILYVNGEYYGIYCLKEDFSRQYYASHAGVSKSSVTMYRTPAPMGSGFFDDVVVMAWEHSLGEEEYYRRFCELVDEDSFIDWFLFEGYSANTDIQGNARVFSSPENGGKWVFAFYDLDWAFYYNGSDFTILLEQDIGNAGNQMPAMLRGLITNPEFRQKVLQRYAQLSAGVLSNEHVVAKIDELEALLEPDAARDRDRWGLSMDEWHAQVDLLRHFVWDNNWEIHSIDKLCWYLQVSDEERAAIFGR